MKNEIDWIKQRPVAHRGLHDPQQGIIENTKTAFAAAIQHNYTIECDLQLTKDGNVVIFHDTTLERLTKQEGAVKERTTQELLAIEFENSSDKMQTLGQLLAQVNGAVPLVLELKTLRDGDVSLAKRAIEIVADYKGKFCFMSFAPTLVSTVKTFAPHISRGAVVMPQTEQYWTMPALSTEPAVRYIDLIEPDFLSYDVRGFPRPFAQEFRAAGKPTISWTVRDKKTADFAYKHSDQITFEGFLPANGAN